MAFVTAVQSAAGGACDAADAAATKGAASASDNLFNIEWSSSKNIDPQ
jgi:hypothetical protein